MVSFEHIERARMPDEAEYPRMEPLCQRSSVVASPEAEDTDRAEKQAGMSRLLKHSSAFAHFNARPD
jgi:hypothetical protein